MSQFYVYLLSCALFSIMLCSFRMTDSGRKNKEMKVCVDNEGKKACVENEGSRVGGDGNESKEKNSADASSSSVLPCIDKLRDELSCAVRTL